MSTYYEKTPPKFAVGETVFINENGDGWDEGEVLEVGDETILVQWSDLSEPSEHPQSEWYLIHHNMKHFHGTQKEDLMHNYDTGVIHGAKEVIETVINNDK